MKWIMADKARIEAEKRATANVGSTSAETDGTSVSVVSDDEEKKEDQKALFDESTE